MFATLFAVRLTNVSETVPRRSLWLATAVVVQVAIGYTQYFLNLPPGVVELHVAGATLLWASTLWLQLGFTAPTLNLSDAGVAIAKPRSDNSVTVSSS